MSDMLRSKYPQEITIVLQHQFWDLNRSSRICSRCALSFNNIPEKLVVPFAALTGFADPSTKFGLQFHSDARKPERKAVKQPKPARFLRNIAATDLTTDEDKESAEIITLDAFRKK